MALSGETAVGLPSPLQSSADDAEEMISRYNRGFFGRLCCVTAILQGICLCPETNSFAITRSDS
jgi:hypothetical protein